MLPRLLRFFYHITSILFLMAFSLSTISAQKLPNVQQASLRTPADVKIDGKFTEWGGQFQAHNRSTDIFYTISNDDENLYFAIQATDPNIISNKILTGGITLVIQPNNKKSDKDGISISYPFFEKGNVHRFNLNDKKNMPTSTELLKVFNDSVMISNNNILTTSAKDIKIKGVPGLDTVISIYNERRIKATALFDINKTYTYELSLPLSLMGLSGKEHSKFAYHILLNGGSSRYAPPNFVVTSGMNRDHTSFSQAQIDQANAALNNINLMFETTDLWGIYETATKP